MYVLFHRRFGIRFPRSVPQFNPISDNTEIAVLANTGTTFNQYLPSLSDVFRQGFTHAPKERDREEGRPILAVTDRNANADMGAGEIQQLCVLSDKGRELLEVSARRMQLSARAYHRVIKLSRTIADLDHSRYIDVQHVAEAIQYRPREVVE